jgi:hypothetical protein
MDWGQSNFVNPPFRKDDGLEGKGVVAFVSKAIAEAEKGKTSVIIMPVFDYITVLAACRSGVSDHSVTKVAREGFGAL